MIRTSFDIKDFSNILQNTVQYSNGFIRGIESSRIRFNDQLGELTAEMLKKYIDSRARAERDSLHHVYEWNAVGNPSGRLYEIESKASISNITLWGKFLPSKSISDSSDEPFVNKAEIMENAILIEIAPKNNVLAFESDGETVFTADTIYIANPGGDDVAGSFGRAVEDFFSSHFTAQVLMQSGLINKLSNPKEYAQYFSSGVKGGGSAMGETAGKTYLTVKGIEFS
jgi:hypothetical protein